MTTDISNNDDVIDSRDVIARIEELTVERDELKGAVEEAEEQRDEYSERVGGPATDAKIIVLGQEVASAKAALAVWLESEEGAELKALEALQEEAEDYAPDWKHGATLIRGTYFQEYAQELADDLGDQPRDGVRWPYTCIDWKKAADELKYDYTSADFDGVEYWVR